MSITVDDGFCGGGGLGLGLTQAGLQVIDAWDFDKNAVVSYMANLGDHVRQADITKMGWQDKKKADIWAFGFPCQDLSVAGLRKGLYEGSRSTLFFEQMRILDEVIENAPDKIPSILLAENVKGLKKYLPSLEAEFSKRGYKMYVQLYNSKYWDVAQNRERYFIVASKLDKPFIFPEEQHEYVPRLSEFLETEVDGKYYVRDEIARTVIAQALSRLENLGIDALVEPAILRNVRTEYGKKIRKAYEAGEVKEPWDAMRTKEPRTDGVSNTLTGVLKDNLLLEPKPKIDVVGSLNVPGRYKMENNVHSVNGISPTLAGSRTNYSPKIPEPQIDVIGMLDTNWHDHSRRVHDPNGLSPTVTAVAGGTHHIKIFDYSRYRARKLTPREYARLQGFPDSYKLVVSDGGAYKIFGNAVSVPVAKAVGGAIKTHLGG